MDAVNALLLLERRVFCRGTGQKTAVLHAVSQQHLKPGIVAWRSYSEMPTKDNHVTPPETGPLAAWASWSTLSALAEAASAWNLQSYRAA